MRLPLLLMTALAVPGLAGAQGTLPTSVTAGLDSLRSGNCEAAFRTWTYAWNTPDDAAKRQTLIGSCTTLAQMGAYFGYDVVRTVSISPNVLRIYIVLRYEVERVYLYLVAYRPHLTWKVTGVFWNTNPDRLFPPNLLSHDTAGP